MKRYYHDKIRNKIVVSFRMKKMQDGVKVYFYRNIDERDMTDYPIAYGDTPNGNELEWPQGFEILGINIKRPILWGLLGYRWEVLEEME